MKGILVLWIVGLTIAAMIGGFLWPYTVNSWLVFFGKQSQMVFWQGALLGFVPGIGQVCVPAAVITWILLMFLA